MHVWMRRMAVVAVVLTACVVMLGAYTRLKDAGLGCPDWPGCYGHVTVPLTQDAVAKANALYPEQPLDATRAWPEMVHRHFAQSLGLLIVSLLVMTWWARRQTILPWRHVLFLFVWVCFQGALGAWTVTMKVYPPVVMAHLLGGFTLLAALLLLALRLQPAMVAVEPMRPVARRWAVLGLVLLVGQIALGGWTAANYAAMHCVGSYSLPLCHPGWREAVDFGNALRLFDPVAATFQYAPHLGDDAKRAIHVLHRLGAMIAGSYLIGLAVILWRRSQSRRFRALAAALLLVVLTQIGLGLANVLFGLPLAVAVAHNATAAALLLLLVGLLYALWWERREKHYV